VCVCMSTYTLTRTLCWRGRGGLCKGEEWRGEDREARRWHASSSILGPPSSATHSSYTSHSRYLLVHARSMLTRKGKGESSSSSAQKAKKGHRLQEQTVRARSIIHIHGTPRHFYQWEGQLLAFLTSIPTVSLIGQERTVSCAL